MLQTRKFASFLVILLMSLLVSSLPVRAEGEEKELKELYAKADQAVKKKDAKFLNSMMADDYTSKNKEGKVKDYKQSAAETEGMFTSIKDVVNATSKVESVKAGKDGEYVIEVTQSFTMTMDGPDGKSHEMAGTAKSRETWVKTMAGWKIKHSEELNSTVTMDGAPMN